MWPRQERGEAADRVSLRELQRGEDDDCGDDRDEPATHLGAEDLEIERVHAERLIPVSNPQGGEQRPRQR
jgi:hypothetical protein